MPSSSDVIINIRERGARQAGQEISATGTAVGRFGASAKTASQHTATLGKATAALGAPVRRLGQEALGLAKSFVGIGLAFGSVEGIKRSIQTTDDLVKSTIQLHNQFGLTTESASSLSGVLQTRGISPMALRMGFVTLSKALVGAHTGTKGFRQDFRRIGLDARDVTHALGSSSGLSRVFETVTDRMTRMQGGARKAALGQDLLGRASRGLAPLLQEGALGLRQQLKWAKEFGVTLDGHTIKSVEQMAAAQTKAQYAALGLQIQMGQLLAPALTKINATFSGVVKSFRDGRPEGNKYAKTIYQIGKDLEPLGKGLATIGKILKDHPKLMQAAGLAVIGYKLKLFSLMRIGPQAFGQGLIAGRAYGAGVEAGMTGERATFASLGTRMGGWIGPAMATAAAVYLGKQLYDRVVGSFTNLLAGPADATIATDTNPAVIGTRAWARFNRQHPGVHAGFLRRYPVARRAESQFLDLSTQPLMPGRAGAYQDRRSRDLESYLRSIGDPMFTPRSVRAARRIIVENHITLKTPDGKVLLRQIQRAQADQRARR